jgi:hypothetical protein
VHDIHGIVQSSLEVVCIELLAKRLFVDLGISFFHFVALTPFECYIGTQHLSKRDKGTQPFAQHFKRLLIIHSIVG